MASDSSGDGSAAAELPEPLRRWLEEKASEEGRSEEAVLAELLSAYRTVEDLDDGEAPVAVPAGEDGELPPALAAAVERLVDERLAAAGVDDAVDVEAFNGRVGELESRFTELLEDVRERVLQVRREADAKADADHGHPELSERVGEVEDLESELEATAADLAALQTRVDAGFDNYETILEYLADSLEEVAARQTTLARALVETREELRKLAARDSARTAADSLRRTAAEHGISTAECGDCGASVDLGLLTRAECPHCSVGLVDVEPAQGFFGSDTLASGERPALEGGDGDGFEFGVDDLIEEEPTVDTSELRADLGDDEEADG